MPFSPSDWPVHHIPFSHLVLCRNPLPKGVVTDELLYQSFRSSEDSCFCDNHLFTDSNVRY